MSVNDSYNSNEPIPPELNSLRKEIVDAAFKVYKSLGPGLLERIYEVCLCHELSKKGIKTVRQIELPIKYDGLVFDEGLRLDLPVNDEVIYELKAVDQVNEVWEAQILNHLKLLDKRFGYLINFNGKNIGKGIKRFVI